MSAQGYSWPWRSQEGCPELQKHLHSLYRVVLPPAHPSTPPCHCTADHEAKQSRPAERRACRFASPPWGRKCLGPGALHSHEAVPRHQARKAALKQGPPYLVQFEDREAAWLQNISSLSPAHPHLLRLAFHLTFPIWLNASLLSFLREGKVTWSLRDAQALWI